MTTSNETTGAGPEETAALSETGLGAVADRLVEQARAEGVALTGEGGLLTGLVQRVLQSALEAEITDHLGHEGSSRLTRCGGSELGHGVGGRGVRGVVGHRLGGHRGKPGHGKSRDTQQAPSPAPPTPTQQPASSDTEAVTAGRDALEFSPVRGEGRPAARGVRTEDWGEDRGR